jgi:hypothetical protein
MVRSAAGIAGLDRGFPLSCSDATMRKYKPRAYAQGELDNLCGVYAVVNAVRHTLGPVQHFRGR